MQQTAFIRYADGSFQRTDSLTECARALRQNETRLWLDLDQPDEWMLALLGEAFEFHPLAIEDCLHGEQRVRIDPYGDYFFMVMYAPIRAARGRTIESRELAMFCSARYVVTVHHQPIDSIASLLARCERDPGAFLSRGMDHLLHVIVDSAVDQYGPILDRLEDETTELEDRAVDDPTPEVLERLMMVKSDLLQIRRFLGPVRDVVAQLARGEFGFVGAQMQLYFRDILDHLMRTMEMIEVYRDLVSGARDIYLSSMSQRLNEVMKVLTIFATIMLPLSLVAGIYGMNIEHLWPPTDRPWSFALVMGMMLAITGALLYFFRRRRWI
jgi:magnesium transporter